MCVAAQADCLAEEVDEHAAARAKLAAAEADAAASAAELGRLQSDLAASQARPELLMWHVRLALCCGMLSQHAHYPSCVPFHGKYVSWHLWHLRVGHINIRSRHACQIANASCRACDNSQ